MTATLTLVARAAGSAEPQHDAAHEEERDHGPFGPYNPNPNWDLRGVALGRRDCYAAIAYGYRLLFFVDTHPGTNGRGDFIKIHPLRFESIELEGLKLKVKEVIYDNFDGGARFFISLHYILGHGPIELQIPRFTEEDHGMVDDVVQVIQAGIAASNRRFAH